MALTFTLIKGAEAQIGQVRELIYDVFLDNSYPTGGWTVLPRDVGVVNVISILITGTYLTTGAAKTAETVFQYDPNLRKLQAFETGAAGAALEEKNEATGLNTTVVRIRVVGY